MWPSSMSALGRLRLRMQSMKFWKCNLSRIALELLGDDLAAGLEHLPAQEMPAQVHHSLGAVDLDPRRALQPIGHLVVGAGSSAGVLVCTGVKPVFSKLMASLSHWKLTICTSGISPPSSYRQRPPIAGDRLRVRRFAQEHSRQVELVDAVGRVAAGEIPPAVPAAVHLAL